MFECDGAQKERKKEDARPLIHPIWLYMLLFSPEENQEKKAILYNELKRSIESILRYKFNVQQSKS